MGKKWFGEAFSPIGSHRGLSSLGGG